MFHQRQKHKRKAQEKAAQGSFVSRRHGYSHWKGASASNDWRNFTDGSRQNRFDKSSAVWQLPSFLHPTGPKGAIFSPFLSPGQEGWREGCALDSQYSDKPKISWTNSKKNLILVFNIFQALHIWIFNSTLQKVHPGAPFLISGTSLYLFFKSKKISLNLFFSSSGLKF